VLTKTVKIRIKDSSAAKELNRMARAVNFVWNYCNDTSFNAIRNSSKFLSGFDLNNLTAGSSKELGLASGTIQLICQEYALRRVKVKKRKLRWRSKRSLGWVPFKANGIQIKDGQLLHRGKTYSLFQPERLPESSSTGEFCRDSRGRWYVCLSVKYETETLEATGEVGIDLGLKDVASLSNGKKVSNNRYYRMMERKLGMAQRAKKKRQVKTIHAKIKNKRSDDLHKASTEIVKDNQLIVVGKFGAKALAKTKMAKSIHDAATTMFKTMLKYKANAHQRQYVEVSENFSTQTCSSCGVIPTSSPKGLKGLAIREWVCECGAVHDRDTNAALNILRFGRESLEPKVA